MVLAIIAGYLLGTLCAYFLARWLLDYLSGKLATHPVQARWIRVTGGIFGAISLAPAIFFAVLVGGFIERGNFGLVIAGLAAVIAGTVTVVTAMGATSGYLLARGILSSRPQQ